MRNLILITGGAGFIGSHLSDALIKRGYQVRVLDNLSKQVHQNNLIRPNYLDPDVELIIGDIRDRETVKQSLKGVEAVFHFAAAVGVGQSMYEIARYTDVNTLGTAILLEELISQPVSKLVVASSMSIYGEGSYRSPEGTIYSSIERKLEQIREGDWEIRGLKGEILVPIPTHESKKPSLASIYALSKYNQEKMCLMVGRTYNIPTVALRFFNVFGTRQSTSNPYTGVLAIFASQILNNRSPNIFEDGEQRRDFVSVYDVVDASILAFECLNLKEEVFNIGSGRAYTIREVAELLIKAFGCSKLIPNITKQHRVGDIRNCFGDITRAQQILNYKPKVYLEAGINEFSAWASKQSSIDQSKEAFKQLLDKGLTI